MILVAIGGDREEGVASVNAPHSARRCPAVRQPVSSMFRPARRARAGQVLMGLCQRPRGARARIASTAAGADARAEELFGELDHIAAGDAVAHRQRRDGRLQARAEGAASELGGQLTRVRAPQPGQRTRGQRCSITPWTVSPAALRPGDAQAHPARRSSREDVTTAAALGPVLDHLIDRAGRQQVATVALVPAGLAPCERPEGSLPRLAGATLGGSALGGAEELRELRFSRRSSWAIRSSWRATRASSADLLVHAKQHLDHDLAPRVVDRLRFSALHTTRFDARSYVPQTN